MSVDFWDGFWAQEQLGSGRANRWLAEHAEGLTPGTALDLGCGEGLDALWLASRGWQVTVVDVSATVLGRAVARAGAAGLHLDAQRHDLAASFPDGSFDLVSAQFLQSPVDFPRERVLKQAARAVSVGGTLVVVAHAAAPPGHEPAAHGHDHGPPTGAGISTDTGHGREADFPTPQGDLAALRLDPLAWRVDRCEVVARHGPSLQGHVGSWLDSVVVATRTS